MKTNTRADDLTTLVAPLLRLAAASAAGRAIKGAATEMKGVAVDASTRLALMMGAGLAAAVGIFCFSTAALTVMQRYMDPAAAWAAIGCFYGLLGCAFYFVATRRR